MTEQYATGLTQESSLGDIDDIIALSGGRWRRFAASALQSASHLTSGTFTPGTYSAAGSTWTDLGTVTTVDINGGTIDGTAIGGSTPAAVAATTLTVASTSTFKNTMSFSPTSGAKGVITWGTVAAEADSLYLRAVKGAYLVSNSDASNNYAGIRANGLFVASGGMALGATSTSSNAQLYATKTYSAASGTDIGGFINVTQSAATTGGLRAFQSIVTASHTTGTVAEAIAARAATTLSGSGGTTTSAYGFVSQMTVGAGHTASNEYVYYGAATNTGTVNNPWMFYGATAIPSYFAGALRIGTTSATSHAGELIRVSAAGSTNPLVNIHASDSAGALLQFTNSDTGTAAGAGVIIGINAAEEGVFIANLPTSDPGVTGQLWNNGGVVNVS